MPPSRVGTVDLTDTKTRVHVDEDLNEVDPGSPLAAFIYKRSDLDRLRARRKELLGIKGDEAERAQRQSHKVALAEARRRAEGAAAEVAVLEARVVAGDKAEKATAKTAGDKAE